MLRCEMSAVVAPDSLSWLLTRSPRHVANTICVPCFVTRSLSALLRRHFGSNSGKMKRPATSRVARVFPRALLAQPKYKQTHDDDLHLFANDAAENVDPLEINTPLGPLIDSIDMPLQGSQETYRWFIVNPFALLYTMSRLAPQFCSMLGADGQSPCEVSIQLWADEVTTNNPLRSDQSGKYQCFQLTFNELPRWVRSGGGPEHRFRIAAPSGPSQRRGARATPQPLRIIVPSAPPQEFHVWLVSVLCHSRRDTEAN